MGPCRDCRPFLAHWDHSSLLEISPHFSNRICLNGMRSAELAGICLIKHIHERARRFAVARVLESHIEVRR